LRSSYRFVSWSRIMWKWWPYSFGGLIAIATASLFAWIICMIGYGCVDPRLPEFCRNGGTQMRCVRSSSEENLASCYGSLVRIPFGSCCFFFFSPFILVSCFQTIISASTQHGQKRTPFLAHSRACCSECCWHAGPLSFCLPSAPASPYA
jgi:hypothetical protein